MARRTGLGKGLGALIPTEASGDETSALRQVPISDIQPNPLQPRRHFDEAAMAALAASIRQLGVLQPILVRELDDGRYELVAGERRWRAARRAGLQTMPVLVQSATTEVASLEQALVENLHREDLNALEEAAAYQQLIDEFGLTHEEVASRVGRSRAAITNTLRLLQLPTGVQRAVAERAISPGHARALLGTPDRSLQESLVARIVADGLTVRATEDLVRELTSPDDQAAGQDTAAIGTSTTSGSTGPAGSGRAARDAAHLPEPGILELEELLSTHLNTRVKVEMRQRRGRVQIEFATLEDLERIYRVMIGAAPAGSAGTGAEARPDGADRG